LLLTTLLVVLGPACAQEGGQKPAEPAEKAGTEKAAAPEKTASKPELPFQIQLLETRVRFEVNGDSRKEVHTIVKINNVLGAREFARLTFDYNRAFQQVEIPLVRISHANGGTSELLPSAVVDAPNPAVEKFPAYQDVRVKSVRILGLADGDTIEYRVITTTTKHPLAPDFWLEHTFDRSGQVLQEHYQLDLPASILAASAVIVVRDANVRRKLESRLYPTGDCPISSDLEIDPKLVRLWTGKVKKHPPKLPKVAENPPPLPPDEPLPPLEYGKVQIFVKPSVPLATIEKSGDGSEARVSYTWHRAANAQGQDTELAELRDLPDLEVGKSSTWPSLSAELYEALELPDRSLTQIPLPEEIVALGQQLTVGANTHIAKTERIYDYVSQKIRTVELPLGATGFRPRPLAEIASSDYATPEDKFYLFQALAKVAGLEAGASLIGPSKNIAGLVVTPSVFHHLVVQMCDWWLDPSLEVAPFRMLPASYRGSAALHLGYDIAAAGAIVDLPLSSMVETIPEDLPFSPAQSVVVDSQIDAAGELKAKVKYTLRGDNELLLRVAFHQTAKEKWKDVAGLLAISDGFRGQVTSVNVSDPLATKDPFTVEYEITQAKFVDWSKKPVRIPALLPQIGLPEPPAKPAAGEAAHAIELGTPLDVDTQMTLRLPAGTVAQVPAGSSVERDYAKFSSKYAAAGNTVTASRRVNFLLREIPGDRAMDYSAFVRAVQSDQAQMLTLVGAVAPTDDAKPLKTPPKQ